MATYSATVKSPFQPSEAFDYLIDLTNLQEWDPGVSQAFLENDTKVGEHAEYFVKANGVKLHYSIDEYDRPTMFAFSAKSLLFRSIDKISFTETREGCEVTYLAKLGLNFGLSLFNSRVERKFKQICDDAGAGLAKALKGEIKESGLL